MPRKLSPHKSYGEKLVNLFGRLLFSGKSYSLTELSHILNCSKPTVLRLIEDIKKGYGVDIQETFNGNRKYLSISSPPKPRHYLTLTESEMELLWMCRSFAEHLLGRSQIEDATRALFKTRTMVKVGRASPDHFASFKPGTIDYTNHQDSFRKLLEAMNKRSICKISYKGILVNKASTFYIMPLKLFSRHETVYIHARFAGTPGKPYQKPDYDPLLVLHRILSVDITEKTFQYPEDYDFEKTFNRHFGIMAGDPFEVEVEFKGKPAEYVSERTWSQDQKIEEIPGAPEKTIRLTFTSSSRLELVSWVLSFGDLTKVIRPQWLVEQIKEMARKMSSIYQDDE